MKVGVVGIGVVGAAVAAGISHVGHEVKTFDIAHADTRIDDVLDTEVCFICVPTKTDEQGVCDTSIVEEVVATLAARNYTGLITIKSTTTPGTTDRINAAFPEMRIGFCPEFLRERAAEEDFVNNHDVCVIGAYTEEDFELVKAAHGSLPRAFSHLPPLEAEFVKYFSNVYNALRIVFANEFYEACKAAGADYAKVKSAVTLRDTIDDHYLDCSDDIRGYGGVCLPKDTRAFAAYVQSLGLTDLKLFEAIVNENAKFRTTVFEGMRNN